MENIGYSLVIVERVFSNSRILKTKKHPLLCFLPFFPPFFLPSSSFLPSFLHSILPVLQYSKMKRQLAQRMRGETCDSVTHVVAKVFRARMAAFLDPEAVVEHHPTLTSAMENFCRGRRDFCW